MGLQLFAMDTLPRKALNGDSMKALLAFCSLATMTAAFAPARAQAQSASCTLVVHVDGFRNHKGDLGVTVFNSPEGWPENNDKAFHHEGFSFSGQEATARLQVPAGRYGVAVLHDENSNHKLDRNFIGFPKEGFGFSNNPKVNLSAPSFGTAAFQVNCPATEISINLIYK